MSRFVKGLRDSFIIRVMLSVLQDTLDVHKEVLESPFLAASAALFYPFDHSAQDGNLLHFAPDPLEHSVLIPLRQFPSFLIAPAPPHLNSQMKTFEIGYHRWVRPGDVNQKSPVGQ